MSEYGLHRTPASLGSGPVPCALPLLRDPCTAAAGSRDRDLKRSYGCALARLSSARHMHDIQVASRRGFMAGLGVLEEFLGWPTSMSCEKRPLLLRSIEAVFAFQFSSHTSRTVLGPPPPQSQAAHAISFPIRVGMWKNEAEEASAKIWGKPLSNRGSKHVSYLRKLGSSVRRGELEKERWARVRFGFE
jgi:hypothetical protein